jgi:hypothetical protein
VSIRSELEEIAHTGGTVTFYLKTDAEGRFCYSVEYRHSRRTAAAMFAVYALPQGIAVRDIKLGGIGDPWNPPPLPGCVPVFISSDDTGMFGQQCPSCKGYWRSHGGTICPYCAYAVAERYHFLTDAQRRYVKQYCDLLAAALDSGQVGEHIIDMDAVADAIGKDSPKPPFYYVEERQQNTFTCLACSAINDVLGTYAYCCSCGTRNDLAELGKTIDTLRARINAGGAYETCAKEAVAAFDSVAGQYARQLLLRVPLSPARRARVEKARFHSLMPTEDLFREVFDIHIFRGMNVEDIAFTKLMFHRRHVYEHKGGEADEKYLADSGDQVRFKQALRETQESSHRIASLVIRIAKNLHEDFHKLFPPLDEPIKLHENSKR